MGEGDDFVGASESLLTKNTGKKNHRADLCDAGQRTGLVDNKFETVEEERTVPGNCPAF